MAQVHAWCFPQGRSQLCISCWLSCQTCISSLPLLSRSWYSQDEGLVSSTYHLLTFQPHLGSDHASIKVNWWGQDFTLGQSPTDLRSAGLSYTFTTDFLFTAPVHRNFLGTTQSSFLPWPKHLGAMLKLTKMCSSGLETATNQNQGSEYTGLLHFSKPTFTQHAYSYRFHLLRSNKRL